MRDEFPSGKRPWFSGTAGRMGGAARREASKRFDAELLRRYQAGATYRELGETFLMGTSTIKDRVDNARKRAAADAPTKGEVQRRAQASEWRELAVILGASLDADESRREEFRALAEEQMRRARALDKEFGEP